MIVIDISGIKYIELNIKEDIKKSNKVLKKAINSTAKKATKMIAKNVAKNYVEHKKKGGSNSKKYAESMKVKKASVSNLESVISSKSGSKELLDFKVTPRSAKETPKVYKAKVLKSGKLKKLQKDGIKAFITVFKNGHESIVTRTASDKSKDRKAGKESYITRHNQKLKVLYSVSETVMLGGEHGYLEAEEDIYKTLEEELNKEMERSLAKRGGA